MTGLIIGIVVAVIALASTLHIVQQYERGVVFCFRRVIGEKQPGLLALVPFDPDGRPDKCAAGRSSWSGPALLYQVGTFGPMGRGERDDNVLPAGAVEHLVRRSKLS
jgi:hypothetical protein